MRRALLVSAAVSAGFLSVFLVAGVISYNFTNWINENAKYATGAIGPPCSCSVSPCCSATSCRS